MGLEGSQSLLGQIEWRTSAAVVAWLLLLRGIALGFRNLDHYILRSIIRSGQIQTTVQAL